MLTNSKEWKEIRIGKTEQRGEEDKYDEVERDGLQKRQSKEAKEMTAQHNRDNVNKEIGRAQKGRTRWRSRTYFRGK